MYKSKFAWIIIIYTFDLIFAADIEVTWLRLNVWQHYAHQEICSDDLEL